MEAMVSGNAGSNNTVIGKFAGAVMTGANNVALGDRALNKKPQSPTINIAIGSGAAKEVTTGISNIIIGYLAGNHGVNLQTGRYNTVIGHYADVVLLTQTMQILLDTMLLVLKDIQRLV